MEKKQFNRFEFRYVHLYIAIIAILCFIFQGNAHLTLSSDSLSSPSHYFLSPLGNDKNPGTINQPWKSLDKANQVLMPGDTVTLKKGTYVGIINPINANNTSKESITYQSDARNEVILTGEKNSNYVINMIGKHFVIIDGFKILPRHGGFGYIENCNNITIKNSNLTGSSGVYIQLLFKNSHHNRFLFNDISEIRGDGCRFLNSGHNLIEGNSFSKIGHSPLNFYALSTDLTSHNIIRGNVFHNEWGRNFELFNPDRCLFENNIFTNAFNGAWSADSYSKILAFNSIFRNNFFYDNWGGVVASGSYEAKLGGDSGYDPNLKAPDETTTLMLVDSRIYNNTFANNPAYAWTLGGIASNRVEPIRSNVFKNNLFYRNGYTGDFTIFKVGGSGVSTDNIFSNNLFFGDKKVKASIELKNKIYFAENLNNEFPDQFINNISKNPLFIDFRNRYFALASNSPAINSGEHYTYTKEAGSGKILEVKDARYFFDGFEIKGELGDLIAVGSSGNYARVIKADIENNILTLDRSLRWEKDVPVSLPYSGKAPDIGTIQYANEGVFTVHAKVQPSSAIVGHKIAFEAKIFGAKGNAILEWNMGDGTVIQGSSPNHIFKEAGEYVVRLKCTDISGANARNIFLIRVKAPKDPDDPLVKSTFEDQDNEEWKYLWDRGPSRGDTSFYPMLREDDKGQAMCVSTQGNNLTLATNIKLRIWDIDEYP